MLESMINKLEEQAEASATKQGYCDKAMSETSASKEDKEDDIEKLAIQIDVLSAAEGPWGVVAHRSMYMSLCLHTCTYICEYIYIYMCMCIIYLHMYTPVYIYMYAHVHMCM